MTQLDRGGSQKFWDAPSGNRRVESRRIAPCSKMFFDWPKLASSTRG
jgi:hypothetical protein